MGVTDQPINRLDAFQQRHRITAFGFAVARREVRRGQRRAGASALAEKPGPAAVRSGGRRSPDATPLGAEQRGEELGGRTAQDGLLPDLVRGPVLEQPGDQVLHDGSVLLGVAEGPIRQTRRPLDGVEALGGPLERLESETARC